MSSPLELRHLHTLIALDEARTRIRDHWVPYHERLASLMDESLAAFGEAILNEINESTIVIPGHGQVATYTDLEEYVSMLKAIRDRLAVLIADGATLDEVISAKPTAEWDAVEGDPTRLLNRAYRSMTR